ncbi:HIPL1 protein [Dichanthelium oligosanthes]|uniref:HIPL1 protein n=1 Tax=Dichanthelium oligosanthes TaxID=888268 RepID=A0A1E5VEM8_9POAL|nr:HIPL1 protein [Dichanthelium oligosanthes]
MRPSTVTGAVLVATVLLLVAVRDGHCAQLCMDSTAFPRTINGSLSFCGYNGTSCCNATDDAAVQKQFAAMNISGTPCGDIVKNVLCARCNPYAGDLFTVTTSPRTVPLLCNTTGVSSRLSTKPAATMDYCTQVWDTCKDVSIPGSPFQAPKGGAAAPKLTDVWQSVSDFCGALGGSGKSPCLDGEGAAFNATRPALPLNGMCLERIGNGSYLNMAAHPDGSNRVFLSNQAGKVFLATVPAQGSGKKLQLDVANPFLDITDEVHYDNEFGLMGLAFHPDFATNGRFFVSYDCDKTQSASCAGRCACNSDVGCDPAKLIADNGAQPCQYQSVIAEYTANATSGTPATATSANPTEVRRIMTLGLPFTTHHGGQILFGPADGYMYFAMGDGGSVGDPWNFAQNKKSLLGKIVRIDVNTMPSGNTTAGWGNYGVPKDNPSAADPSFAPEVFALGFKNPWRCSFDSGKPSYMYCADVGQAVYEEVDLVMKGGNYGWRVFEGTQPYTPLSSPGGNTSAASIDAISPIMGYAHSSVNSNVGSASITGGYVYRSTVDPCLNGRYLYADLYAKSMWAGTESPEDSGVYDVAALTFSCSKSSPIPCDVAAGSALPSLGYIFSFGEDNARDVYLLTSKGVYRVVDPAECSYACPIKSSAPGASSPAPGASPSSAVAARAPALATLLAGVLLSLPMSLMSV